jgi:hypothetical protein
MLQDWDGALPVVASGPPARGAVPVCSGGRREVVATLLGIAPIALP